MLLLYRLYDWQTMNRKDIRDILKAQAANTQLEFEHRTKEVIVQFAEQVGMQTVCCCWPSICKVLIFFILNKI